MALWQLAMLMEILIFASGLDLSRVYNVDKLGLCEKWVIMFYFLLAYIDYVDNARALPFQS